MATRNTAVRSSSRRQARPSKAGLLQTAAARKARKGGPVARDLVEAVLADVSQVTVRGVIDLVEDAFGRTLSKTNVRRILREMNDCGQLERDWAGRGHREIVMGDGVEAAEVGDEE